MGRGPGGSQAPECPPATPKLPAPPAVFCQGGRAAGPPPSPRKPGWTRGTAAVAAGLVKNRDMQNSEEPERREGLGGGGEIWGMGGGSLGQGVVQKPVGPRVVVKYRGEQWVQRPQNGAGRSRGHRAAATALPWGAAALRLLRLARTSPHTQQPRPLHSNLISPHRRLGGRPRRGRSCPPWPGEPGSPRPRARGGRSRR